ncbi:XRE family transcriptional regulator [candidate division MSBL1 archaeon SCGC-AAA261D19]|uniref:XRE family transcriptional regulator n=1 Tax=candidate division MSBL1 archaeon SCGC-AAA261D19 TaxID=1698273 RepID=A0A133V6T8_9EURY|nr:XRE family transcriptional regulator [candidate division MSBL1 archaeon SCGC-AAA261D19]
MFESESKNRVAKLVAGDIALSSEPCRALKKWREKFEIDQTTLAEALEISPSVISDYESGRRKSPGVAMIRKIIKALLEVDEKEGRQVTETLAYRFGARLPPDIVLGMRELVDPLSGKELCEAVEGKAIANENLLNQKLLGYTVVNGPKAIIELSSNDFMGLYGLSTERALVFTRVTRGRSPLVAIKVRGITPGAIILHGKIKEPDELGLKIAEDLRVPLIISQVPTVEKLLEGLQNLAE